MNTDAYSVLFEPVKIGSLVARNRFYQVPHCCGMGHLRPKAHAAMRAMKAEGGWAVVSTEETEIHPTSDLSPYAEQRLWDDRDIPALQLMTDAVHQHGALSAIELAHNGHHAANLYTRAPVLAPSELSLNTLYPKQARAMDKSDLRALRQWHKQAVLRAKRAGFDIIYVYAGHHMSIPHHFMLSRFNRRSDEYGGSLENRVRLTRELLEDAQEAMAGEGAIAMRLAVDEMLGEDGMEASNEGKEVVAMLAELPDLWDVNIANWAEDSVTSRFQPEEGYQTEKIAFVKKLTSKPVVAVGRLNSPDLMVSMVKKGLIDFIGAARPSIADPFLPRKIAENRIESIRECIGCNICVSCDNHGVSIRCTQNPTMGEEWRRGWHPEIISPKGKETQVLIIGGGPAGLECAMQMSKRGYQVTLAEAEAEMGGRAVRESRLSGLSAWRRVADHRIYALEQSANVSLYLHSRLDAKEVLELGIPHIFVATGASWRRDGVGRNNLAPVPISAAAAIFTPDDVMGGMIPEEETILIYDDDQAYLASVLAEHCLALGKQVIFVTPASIVAPWTDFTLEQERIQRSLMQRGAKILCNQRLCAVEADHLTLACTYTGRRQTIVSMANILVTERKREHALYDALKNKGGTIQTLELIGDAAMPGLIADAVFSGHLAARNFEGDPKRAEQDWFRREIPALSPEEV